MMEIAPDPRAVVERFFQAFIGIALFFVPFGTAGAVQQEEPILALVGFANQLVVPAVVATIPAIRLLFTRYIIEEDGMRERVQILNRTERRIGWDKVTLLRQRRTFFDWLLRIERLDVIAYGERGATIHLLGLRGSALRDHLAREMRRHASVQGLLQND